ncbi:MAG TPA: ATP-grasp domain-containing protein, partial [Verrucomicrobiae bacterium]|nr:ATP-grasp domain-containing protein [Verrucomicrobiae bacterium]
MAVIGSGPYSIGSSVEFDWCAVNTAKSLHAHGHQTIIINSNPETVSTDFDRSDRLYFDELTLERIQDIADFERPKGLVVSVGGQIANNLALPLMKAGYPILGTSPERIDHAENRQKFSAMLHDLGVDQPAWREVTSLKNAKQFATHVGYPVLIRPSYVLSGGAMNVVRNEEEMEQYLQEATRLSPDHPTVISQFILNAKELEIDAVAKNGKLVIYAISEHIENAGVHSGDATVVYPAQRLYLETVRRAKQIARQVASSLDITGPFNIQFIAKDNELKVIECNVRASRSFPFVSKVSGHNFITIATEAMLGIENNTVYQTLELDHVGIKSPQFSYNRLKGADPVAGVEMASTGEVACFGRDIEEAFYTSWLATEQQVGGKNVFISLPDEQKHKFVEEVAALAAQGWNIYSTAGTHRYFKKHGIPTTKLYKISDKKEPSVHNAVEQRGLDLMISVPAAEEALTETNNDGYKIRRLAIDHHIPLFTNAESSRLMLGCLTNPALQDLQPRYWREYVPA